MDWMEFIASLVRSLAWPMAIVVAVALLKERLRVLLPMVKRAKLGPSGLEWELFDEGRELSSVLESEGAELEERLEAVSGPEALGAPGDVTQSGSGHVAEQPAPSGPMVPEQDGSPALDRLMRSLPADLLAPGKDIESVEFARLVEISPTAAALKVYADMEGTIRREIRANRAVVKDSTPWQHVGRELGLVTADDDRALRWLKKVRNEIAHGEVDMTAGLALDFARLAEQVERNVLIRSILRRQRNHSEASGHFNGA